MGRNGLPVPSAIYLRQIASRDRDIRRGPEGHRGGAAGRLVDPPHAAAIDSHVVAAVTVVVPGHGDVGRVAPTGDRDGAVGALQHEPLTRARAENGPIVDVVAVVIGRYED